MKTFFSAKRTIWSAVAALVVIFYAFNFVPRNINIIATRTLTVKILDYIFNFLMFFVAIYLAITLIVFIIKWCSDKK